MTTDRRGGLATSVVALVGSGVLVNVLLAAVARSLPESEYALFSAFWSVSLIAAFGVFLPVEQWLAQHRPGEPGATGDLRRAGVLTAAFAGALTAALLGIGIALMAALDAGPGMLGALVALGVVSGAQFLARGLLIARGRMDLFALILLLDVVIRVLVALVLSRAGVDHAAPYAWAVVVGIAVAHLPVLAVGWRRGASTTTLAPQRPLVRPVLLLLVGSFGSQVLFNAPAIASTLAASVSQLGEVAAFQAAFQLVRIPLFLAVPLQATLIPVMDRLLHGRESSERLGLLVRFMAGAALVTGAGVALGWFLGPWLVRLLFGARYDAEPGLVALLAAGSGAYLALLVLSQALVADGRHGPVGAAWGIGTVVAAAVFVAVPSPVGGSAWGFTVGSLAGLAWALRAAWAAGSRVSPRP